MKVLMISTDRKIFEADSAVSSRMKAYGSFVEELHIIVFALKNKYPNIYSQKIGDNTYIYSTRSLFRLGYLIDAILLGLKIIKNKKNWVVALQNPSEAGLVGWIISFVRNIPFEIQIHTDFLSEAYLEESIAHKLRAFVARFLLTKASSIRVVSKRIYDSLKKSNIKLKAHPIVLPIYVDIRKITLSQAKINIKDLYPQFDFIFLMVSRLAPEKNIGLAIRAMKSVVSNFPKTGLVIVGGGDEKENLTKEIIKNGLEKNIVLAGWQDDVVSYFKTADAYVHSSNYEGYGMVFVEAGAAGLPVVTTDVGIIGEFFIDGESALVCGVGDEACFGEKMLLMRKDEELRRFLSKNARASIHDIEQKDGTFEEYLSKIVGLWEDTLNKKNI